MTHLLTDMINSYKQLWKGLNLIFVFSQFFKEELFISSSSISSSQYE